MRRSPIVLSVASALAVGLAFGDRPAAGDLAEPPVDRGATAVEVEGTLVRAEARALAKGHDVEAIVVARLDAGPDGKPLAPSRITTYERWTLDGKAHDVRGDRKLGADWEKRLGTLLAALSREAAKPVAPGAGAEKRADARGTLERLRGRLGPEGTRTVDGWILAWSIDVAGSEGGLGRAAARTAIFTLRPAPPSAPTPGDGGDGEPKGDVTPGEGSPELGSPPRGGVAVPGMPSGGGSSESSSSSDSERGARAHSRVTTDLGRSPGSPVTPPAGAPPREGDVTPRER